MKRSTVNIIISFVLSLAVVVACTTEKPEEKVFIPEEEVEIEDTNFLNFCLEHFDYNGDGKFTNYEAGIVVTLDITGKDVRSLKGIENFVRLQNLNCSKNPLTEINLSTSPILRTLDCSDCTQLTALTLEGCKVLHTVNVSGCTALPEEMDLTKTPSLLRLDCSYSAVNTFITPDSMLLQSLYMDGNQAPEGKRDFARFGELRNLSLRSNGMDNLSINGLFKLERFYFSGNEVKGAFNMNRLAGLKVLECSDIAISSLAIDSCRKLDTLICRNTRIRSLKPTTNTALTYIDCSRDVPNTLLSSVDFSSNTQLAFLDCSNNQISLLDMERNTALKRLICADAEIEELGLATCTELESLDCSGNRLDTLDLSKNRKLTTFDVTRNTHPNRPEFSIHVWEGFVAANADNPAFKKDDDAIYVEETEEAPQEPEEPAGE